MWLKLLKSVDPPGRCRIRPCQKNPIATRDGKEVADVAIASDKTGETGKCHLGEFNHFLGNIGQNYVHRYTPKKLTSPLKRDHFQ